MRTLGFRLEKSSQTIHQSVQIERRAFYDHLSCLDLAKIEQVIDKRAKLPRRREQPVDQLALLVRQILHGKQFSGAHDAVERRSHFVAHGSEELALRFACRLGFSARTLRLCPRAFGLRSRTLRLCPRAFDSFTLRLRLSALHLHPCFLRRSHSNQLLLEQLGYIKCRRDDPNKRDQPDYPRDTQIPKAESKPVRYRGPGVHEQHNRASFPGEPEQNSDGTYVNGQAEKASDIGGLLRSINPGEQDKRINNETHDKIRNPGLRTPVHPGVVSQ